MPSAVAQLQMIENPGGEVVAEGGWHETDGARCGFLVALAFYGEQGVAVGLLGAEDDGEFAASQTCTGQSVSHTLAQPAMVRLPQVGILYGRDVGFGSRPHGGDDRLAATNAGG